MYVYTCKRVYVCMYVWLYVACMYVCMHVCVCPSSNFPSINKHPIFSLLRGLLHSSKWPTSGRDLEAAQHRTNLTPHVRPSQKSLSSTAWLPVHKAIHGFVWSSDAVTSMRVNVSLNLQCPRQSDLHWVPVIFSQRLQVFNSTLEGSFHTKYFSWKLTSEFELEQGVGNLKIDVCRRMTTPWTKKTKPLSIIYQVLEIITNVQSRIEEFEFTYHRFTLTMVCVPNASFGLRARMSLTSGRNSFAGVFLRPTSLRRFFLTGTIYISKLATTLFMVK